MIKVCREVTCEYFEPDKYCKAEKCVKELTVEELKAAANKLGYNIVKKKKYIKLLPCTCGCKRRENWYKSDANGYGLFFKCKKCGKTSLPGYTDDESRENWNEMIKMEMEDEE